MMLLGIPVDTGGAGGGIEEVCGDAEPEVVPTALCEVPSWVRLCNCE